MPKFTKTVNRFVCHEVRPVDLDAPNAPRVVSLDARKDDDIGPSFSNSHPDGSIRIFVTAEDAFPLFEEGGAYDVTIERAPKTSVREIPAEQK